MQLLWPTTSYSLASVLVFSVYLEIPIICIDLTGNAVSVHHNPCPTSHRILFHYIFIHHAMRSVAHLSPQLFRYIFMDSVLQDAFYIAVIHLFSSFHRLPIYFILPYSSTAATWILWQVLGFIHPLS